MKTEPSEEEEEKKKKNLVKKTELVRKKKKKKVSWSKVAAEWVPHVFNYKNVIGLWVMKTRAVQPVGWPNQTDRTRPTWSLTVGSRYLSLLDAGLTITKTEMSVWVTVLKVWKP